MQHIPPYPESLKVKTWEKAKGIAAWMSSRNTGVTALLEKAEKAFKSAPWEATADEPLAEQYRRGPEALEEFLRQHHQKYQPAFRQLQASFADLSSDLKSKAKELEKDEKVAKFAALVAKMAEDANKFTYAVAWGSVSDQLQKEAIRLRANFAERKKKIHEHLSKVEPAIEKVIHKLESFKDAPPTTKAYKDLFPQYHRLPGTYISVAAKDAPELKVTFKDFLQYGSDNWTNEPSAKTDMKKLIEADLKVLKKAKEQVAKL